MTRCGLEIAAGETIRDIKNFDLDQQFSFKYLLNDKADQKCDWFKKIMKAT